MQKKKAHNKSVTIISTIAYLLPVFLYRFRYPLPEIEIVNFSLLIEETVIFLFIFYYLLKNKINYKYIIVAICYFILFILHSIIAQKILFSYIADNYIIKSIRFLLYITITYFYAKLFFEKELFFKIFLIYFAIFSIPFLFYIINNNMFQTNSIDLRYAGLFSEPSAVAPFLVFFIFHFIALKKYYIVLVLLIMFFFTNSGLGYIMFFIVGIFYLIHMRKFSAFSVIGFSIFICLIIFIVFNYINFEEITALKKIISLYESTNTELKQSNQARLQNIFNTFDEMNKNNSLIFGYGLNVWEVHYSGIHEMRIFSLFQLIISSFGILSILIFYVIIKRFSFIMKNSDSIIKLFLFVFFISSMLNSAQGLILWKLMFLILFVPNNKIKSTYSNL